MKNWEAIVTMPVNRTKQCTFACLAAAGVIGLCRGAENGVATAPSDASSSRPVPRASRIGDPSTNSAATSGFLWPSVIPADCPFPRSPTLTGVFFTGRHGDYRCGDTFYPSWASDGNLYSPWTDGQTDGMGCGSGAGTNARTAHAVMIGDDPLGLTIRNTSPPRVGSVTHLGNIALRSGREINWDAKAEQIVGDPNANRFLSVEYRPPWKLPYYQMHQPE